MVSAMIKVYADISESDLNGIGRAIDLMMVHTNRSLEQATIRAAYTFIRSAKARTVRAKGKNRKQLGSSAVPGKIISQSGQKRRRSARKPSDKYFAVFNQHQKPYFVRIPDTMTGSKKNRAQARITKQKVIKNYGKKPRIGAAKASWSRAISDLGKPVKIEMLTRNVKVMASSRSKKSGNKFEPTINITNTLNYLLKASSPDMERQAMVAAGKSLLKTVNNRIEAQTRRWK